MLLAIKQWHEAVIKAPLTPRCVLRDSLIVLTVAEYVPTEAIVESDFCYKTLRNSKVGYARNASRRNCLWVPSYSRSNAQAAICAATAGDRDDAIMVTPGA